VTATGARNRGAVRSPHDRLRSVLWHLAVMSVLVVVLYPIAWMVGASLKPSQDVIGSLSLFPPEPTAANYERVFEGIAGISTWTFFNNSLILALLSVVGVVVSSSLAGYAFARIRFRGRGPLFAVMISTLLLPFHVLIIPQYILFHRFGLIDTYVPLLIGKFLAVEAFFVFLMVQFMRNLPNELMEAAKVDGCGHGRIYWHIVLPLARPAFITSAIFAFIWSWNDFFAPLLFLNSPERYPLPLALQLFIDQTRTSDYGALIAMSLLALIPVVLFFLLFQRYLVEGVATQGIKG
jgi:multiple sugar transport system permease protein